MAPQKYPPYVNAYGKISNLFAAIKTAAVPTKFNQDFVKTILGLKSSSYDAMIPFLKRLGFLDPNNSPTQAYRDFRDDQVSKQTLAQQLKIAYEDIFKANEFAHKLDKTQLSSKLTTILGASKDDAILPSIVGTFTELVKLSDFDGKQKQTIKKPDAIQMSESSATTANPSNFGEHKFGISYTINLNLPATTEIEVFNAIFKSLKENLLK